MPFYKEISFPNHTSIYIWKISEEISNLKENLFLDEISLMRLSKMKSSSQIKGFLAVRKLLERIGYSDSDLFYDSFGKPLLKNRKKISISHSHDFACIIISENNVGIDIELKSEKILKNLTFLFNEDFIINFKGNKDEAISLTTFCWGIKEAVYKLIPENDISLKENISILPFQIDENSCVATVNIKNEIRKYKVQLDEIENYTLVYVIE